VVDAYRWLRPQRSPPFVQPPVGILSTHVTGCLVVGQGGMVFPMPIARVTEGSSLLYQTPPCGHFSPVLAVVIRFPQDNCSRRTNACPNKVRKAGTLPKGETSQSNESVFCKAISLSALLCGHGLTTLVDHERRQLGHLPHSPDIAIRQQASRARHDLSHLTP
jgi:hypothetical protein